MSERAKLFMSGGSQAVRLPKAYRFENQKEVLISRKGQQIVLEPTRRRWSPVFLALAGTTPCFPYPEELRQTAVEVLSPSDSGYPVNQPERKPC